jgi:D-threo-aldose 1-dehydrogenase
MDRVRRIEAVCAEYGVPLAAAALQFVVAHPAVPTFMAGTRTVAQLEQNLAWFSHEIPAQFWSDLKAKELLREDAPVPT